jgi:hypothetical protein
MPMTVQPAAAKSAAWAVKSSASAVQPEVSS